MISYILLHCQELNSDPVVPEGFPEWADTMDGWGSTMISTVEVVQIDVFLFLLILVVFSVNFLKAFCYVVSGPLSSIFIQLSG
jgi:hypothetical protein